MEGIRMTNRLRRVIERAKEEAKSSGVLQPVHLLLGVLQESTGAFGEIRLHTNLDCSIIRSNIPGPATGVVVDDSYFDFPVTNTMITIMEQARNDMLRYQQVILNEGHMLKALLLSGNIDRYIDEQESELLLELGTTARDLITPLENYTFPNLPTAKIDRAHQRDDTALIHFVAQHFSTGWADTVRGAFETEGDLTIYIARNDGGDIIGFAGFDIYRQRKGYFGPMGVSRSCRVSGVGYALLHHCLRDMKEMGYAYAVIGGAGPIEFYEKACQAVVIPKK